MIRREDLARPIKLHVCKDGTITYRKVGQPVFNGLALPFFSVDNEQHAEALQILLCALQYVRHPDQPEREWYKHWQFGGELEDIPELADEFRRTYVKMLENAGEL